MKERLLKYTKHNVDIDKIFNILLEGFMKDPHKFSLGDSRDKVDALLEETIYYNRNCAYMKGYNYIPDTYEKDDYSRLTGLYLESLTALDNNDTYDLLLENYYDNEYVSPDILRLMEDYVEGFEMDGLLEIVIEENKHLEEDTDRPILEFVTMALVLSVAWKILLAALAIIIQRLISAFFKNDGGKSGEPKARPVEAGSQEPFKERSKVDFNRWNNDIKKYYQNALDKRNAYSLKIGSGYLACGMSDVLIALIKIAHAEGVDADIKSKVPRLKKDFESKVHDISRATGVAIGRFESISTKSLDGFFNEYGNVMVSGCSELKAKVNNNIIKLCRISTDGEQALKDIADLYNFEDKELMKSLFVDNDEDKTLTDNIKKELKELKADYDVAKKELRDSKVTLNNENKHIVDKVTDLAKKHSNSLEYYTKDLEKYTQLNYGLLKKIYVNADEIRHATLKTD